VLVSSGTEVPGADVGQHSDAHGSFEPILGQKAEATLSGMSRSWELDGSSGGMGGGRTKGDHSQRTKSCRTRNLN